MSRVDMGFPHTNIGEKLIRDILRHIRPQVWVEFGCMTGGSAIKAAEEIRRQEMDTVLLAVDPFSGSPQFWGWDREARANGSWQFLHLEHGRPTIYDRFCANVKEVHLGDVILPITATTVTGCWLINEMRVAGVLPTQPKVIYLDSSHEPDETDIELRRCWGLLPPGGVLFGDDWNWDSVRSAVMRFVSASLDTIAPERAMMAALEPTGSLGPVLLFENNQWLIAKR